MNTILQLLVLPVLLIGRMVRRLELIRDDKTHWCRLLDEPQQRHRFGGLDAGVFKPLVLARNEDGLELGVVFFERQDVRVGVRL